MSAPPGVLVVAVTELDIAAGVPGSCCHCPVARALERSTGKRWVIDGTQAWCLTDNTLWWLCPEARRFVQSVDDGLVVAGFECELREAGRFVRVG